MRSCLDVRLLLRLNGRAAIDRAASDADPVADPLRRRLCGADGVMDFCLLNRGLGRRGGSYDHAESNINWHWSAHVFSSSYLITTSRTIDYENAISVDKAEYIFRLNKNGADDQIFIRVSLGAALRMLFCCLWSTENLFALTWNRSGGYLLHRHYATVLKGEIPMSPR
jgi:hypothetical protein